MNYAADQECIVNIQDLLVATKATKSVPGQIHYIDKLYYLVLEYRERCISVRYSSEQARNNAYDCVAALLTQRAADFAVCSCSTKPTPSTLQIDPACPVHSQN